jgi:hypothetical protein
VTNYCCLEKTLRFPEIRTCETTEELIRFMRLGTLTPNLYTRWGEWSALRPEDIRNVRLDSRAVLHALRWTEPREVCWLITIPT